MLKPQADCTASPSDPSCTPAATDTSDSTTVIQLGLSSDSICAVELAVHNN